VIKQGLAVVPRDRAALLRTVVVDGRSDQSRRLDLDGGGHDEHVAQRSDPPLVDGVVVGAQLHLALARGHLHRVRRAFVVARLLRRARLHVPHDACGVRTGRPLINSVRPVK
jgi:hypothetical protein